MHTIIGEDLSKRKICSRFVLHKLTEKCKPSGWKLRKILLPCPSIIHPFCEESLHGIRRSATSFIRNSRSNQWNAVHKLHFGPRRGACKRLRSGRCCKLSLTMTLLKKNQFCEPLSLRRSFVTVATTYSASAQVAQGWSVDVAT